NRGIDEIRNLKESALVAAPSGGFKVFVIDEVHMLTKDAFNALLKILEEPPSHVVFVLATTEPHKILPTVLSRVQRFDFKRLTPSQIFMKLKEVAQAEKINIEDEGLKAISVSSDGALRDAEVSLSKLRSYQGKISIDTVNDALGLVPFKYHPEFFGYLASANKIAALDLIQRMHDLGVDLENFAKDFLEYSRKVMMAKINPAVLVLAGEELPELHQVDGKRFIKLIQLFTSARNEIRSSPISQLPLELAVLEFLE
ncbi:MAG: AAA family ATPase, partial [bacterium]|nr:AAA family ATPase [bacterium]